MAYRGSAEGATYQHRQKKLAAKDTGGKTITLKDGSLTGDAYDQAVIDEIKNQLHGPSDRAVSRGSSRSHVGAGPCKTSKIAANVGSAPSRVVRSVAA